MLFRSLGILYAKNGSKGCRLFGLDVVFSLVFFKVLNVEIRQIIKTSPTASSKKNSSRISILYKKIPRVKFKKDIIIKCKFLNREKIAGDYGNVEDISKMKWM